MFCTLETWVQLGAPQPDKKPKLQSMYGKEAGRPGNNSKSWGRVKDAFFKYSEGLLFRGKTEFVLFGLNKIERVMERQY